VNNNVRFDAKVSYRDSFVGDPHSSDDSGPDGQGEPHSTDTAWQEESSSRQGAASKIANFFSFGSTKGGSGAAARSPLSGGRLALRGISRRRGSASNLPASRDASASPRTSSGRGGGGGGDSSKGGDNKFPLRRGSWAPHTVDDTPVRLTGRQGVFLDRMTNGMRATQYFADITPIDAHEGYGKDAASESKEKRRVITRAPESRDVYYEHKFGGVIVSLPAGQARDNRENRISKPICSFNTLICTSKGVEFASGAQEKEVALSDRNPCCVVMEGIMGNVALRFATVEERHAWVRGCFAICKAQGKHVSVVRTPHFFLSKDTHTLTHTHAHDGGGHSGKSPPLSPSRRDSDLDLSIDFQLMRLPKHTSFLRKQKPVLHVFLQDSISDDFYHRGSVFSGGGDTVNPVMMQSVEFSSAELGSEHSHLQLVAVLSFEKSPKVGRVCVCVCVFKCILSANVGIQTHSYSRMNHKHICIHTCRR
jgi:hypothetical protein